MRIAISGHADPRFFRKYLPDNVDIPAAEASPLVGSLAAGYLEQGHQICIYTLHDLWGSNPEFHLTTPNVEIHIYPQRRARYVAATFYNTELQALTNAISKSGADVVHGHWTGVYGLAAIRSGLPSVVTAHDLSKRIFKLMSNKWYWYSKLVLSKRVYREAANIVANSPYTARYCRAEMNSRAHLDIVPNGLPSWVFEIERTKAPLQAATPVFASAAHGFTSLKNTRTLMQAFSIVTKRYPGARLLLFGSQYGPGQEAEQWAKANGCNSNVEFRGPRDVHTLLSEISADADVWVHPSLEESFGMALAESQALGVPAIGGRNSGAVPWVLDEGLAGVLCDVTDPKSLSEAMIQTIESPDSEMVAYAKRRAHDCFSLEKMCHSYLNILESVAKDAS